jgi:hypothetical protein
VAEAPHDPRLRAAVDVAAEALRKRLAEVLGRVLAELVSSKLSDAELVELRSPLPEPAPTHETDEIAPIVEILAEHLPHLRRGRLYELARRVPWRIDLDSRRLMGSRRAAASWFAAGAGGLLPARHRSRSTRSRRSCS